MRFDVRSADPQAGISGSGVSRIDEAGAVSSVTVALPAAEGGGESQVITLPGEFYIKLPPRQELARPASRGSR